MARFARNRKADSEQERVEKLERLAEITRPWTIRRWAETTCRNIVPPIDPNNRNYVRLQYTEEQAADVSRIRMVAAASQGVLQSLHTWRLASFNDGVLGNDAVYDENGEKC